MKIFFSAVFCVLFISIAASCSISKDSHSITYIKHGSSFGMCRGYCFNEATYTKSEKIAYSKAYGRTNPDEFPDKSDTTLIEEAFWNELINSFEVDSFFILEERIGCPDCADGGSEWIEICENNKTYKVTFENGKPLKSMDKLLKLVREEIK
jgi:hypothetical protein